MAGFAPAFQHESNNAWLNDLVDDIIHPSSRKQRPSYGFAGTDRDDATGRTTYQEWGSYSAMSNSVEDRKSPHPDSSHGRTGSPSSLRSPSPATGRNIPIPSRSSSTRLRQERVSPVPRSPQPLQGDNTAESRQSREKEVPAASAAYSRNVESRLSGGTVDMYDIVEEAEGVLSLNPFYVPTSRSYSRQVTIPDRYHGRENSRSTTHTSRQSQAPLMRSYDQRTRDSISRSDTSRSKPSSSSSITEPDQAHLKLGPSVSEMPMPQLSDASTSREGTVTRTSLGRTLSQQRKSMNSPFRMPSKISMTSSEAPTLPEDCEKWFDSHPAVRPFQTARELLGEAAPPEDDKSEDGEHQYPGSFALTLIIVGVCLSVFIISVDRNIITTAIPQITATFQSYSDVGWYGSSYFLTASAFQPLYGRIYMSFNTRWTFLLALAIFEVGSLLGALSPNSFVLILGRAIQGFGSAGILTGSFVVATHSVRLQHRPVLFACVGILYGVGALCGPLLGGVLTDFLTWRWAFWINLPVGAVTFIAVFFFFKPHKKQTSANVTGTEKQTAKPLTFVQRILKLDLIGNVILLGASIQLFLALQDSETKGSWNNKDVIGLLCGFGATTLIFIGWLIYKGDDALIPPKIALQRTVAASCGTAFFLYGAVLIHAYYLPIWFQAIQGDSAVRSGINMIPYMLANALFSLIAGIFVSKNGRFAPPAILGCAIGTIGSGLIATLSPSSSTGTWLGFEVLVSAGLGMAIQQGFSAVQTALPLDQVPIGTAAVVASQSLGGAIFVAIGNTLLQDHLLSQTNQNAVPGVDLRAVFELGATMFRDVVPADQVPAVIHLYNQSLRGVFIAAVPLCGVAFLCSLCMEWKSVKGDKARKVEQHPEGVGSDDVVTGLEDEKSLDDATTTTTTTITTIKKKDSESEGGSGSGGKISSESKHKPGSRGKNEDTKKERNKSPTESSTMKISFDEGKKRYSWSAIGSIDEKI